MNCSTMVAYQSALITSLAIAVLTSFYTNAFQFGSSPLIQKRSSSHKFQVFSSLPKSEPQEQTLDNYLPPSHPLSALINATAQACEPRRLDTTQDAHEAFRYEWGTWCGEEKLDVVMEVLGDVRLVEGAYDEISEGNLKTEWVGEEIIASSYDGIKEGRDAGRRIRVAGGKYWDVILHVLPKNA
jgi:hypothetical protein